MKRDRTVLVVDDEKTIADGLRLTFESEGYAVHAVGSVREALAGGAQPEPHVAIVDLMLPDGDGLSLTRELKRRDPTLEVIVITAYGSVRKAMEADLRRRLVEQISDSEILGSAPGIQRVMETVVAVAEADANVLIIGESGTGKELIANALHERSRRREGPWIKINCAALPRDLIESELFGHNKGAFTGATTDKTGLLEEADGGSLLLDEIAEMPIDLQAKLLRVLEERVVRRLGGAKSVPVDFRLISSTNRSPEAALKDGRLRQDLFFRINTVSIQVPSLRERREDIPVLVKAFLERYTAKHDRPVEGIEPGAYRRLLAYLRPYVWPHGAIAVACMLAFSATESSIPFLAKFTFDQVFTQHHSGALPLAVAFVLVAAVYFAVHRAKKSFRALPLRPSLGRSQYQRQRCHPDADQDVHVSFVPVSQI